MSKWEAMKGSAGFFVTMAVCLLAIGISGYYLLLDEGGETPPSVVETAPEESAVTAPAEQPVFEEAPAVVEVLAPEPVKETPPMPEIEIDPTPVIAEAPRLIVTPVHGEVVAAFSVDELSYDPTLEDWRTHDGVDIQAASGTTVLSACSGTVLSVSEDALMGTTVVVEHEGGYRTTYANLQHQPPVAAGEIVSAGQILGAVGTTAAAESAQGPHLHFSVSKDGEAVNPHEFLEQ